MKLPWQKNNKTIGPIRIQGGEFDGIKLTLSIPAIVNSEDDGTSTLEVSYDIIETNGHKDLDKNEKFTSLVSRVIQLTLTGNKEYEPPFGKDDIKIVDTQ